MKTIYTVQHTQSIHHTNGMVGSWTDWELTDLGKQQADQISLKLQKELEGKDVVLYSSDLMRAKQTAGFIADRLQVTPSVMAEEAENIIIVSHGDLLSVFNAMFLGLEAESLNSVDLFGFAGGVSQMIVKDDGKRTIRRLSDMSYVG